MNKKTTEEKAIQHYKIATERHLNLNQLLKENFQGKRNHCNKQKDKKRFSKTKTK